LFDLFNIEILESEVTNVTPEENAQVFGDWWWNNHFKFPIHGIVQHVDWIMMQIVEFMV
jgi:hypothetical protein